MKSLNRAVYIFVCTLPLVTFCLLGGKMMFPLATAIAIHEASHVFALKALKGRMKSFSPAPFGLCMEFDEQSVSHKSELVISGAGCIANFIFAGAFIFLYKFFSFDTVDFVSANLLLGCFNMIPAYPLDGARILKILLLFKLNPNTAENICTAVTYFISFIIFVLTSYMFLASVCGIYPMLFSLYLFAKCNKNVFS